ncbi:MAG: LptF/LptG family permease, partial [Bacteroidota bacterium]
MKKIDKLIISSFVPPFILTYFIAVFVFVMQFLWKYIDDIIGKGLDLHYILELIFFRSVALFPTAFPVAILVSSVMVMGNLAEKFELATLKSAGIPLLRIMASMILFCSFISICSFVTANWLIPYSNLKFKSLLYDIRRQKPTLSLSAGIFNEDFGGTIIRIGSKEEDDRTLNDIMIYDHSENRGNVSQLLASKGEMYADDSERYLILKMYEGTQYQEVKPGNREKADNYEHLQITFSEWERVFDLSEFDLQETKEDLFKGHQSMKRIDQLNVALDSLDIRRANRIKAMRRHLSSYYLYERQKTDTLKKHKEYHFPKAMLDTLPQRFELTIADHLREMQYQKAHTLARNVRNYTKSSRDEMPRISEAIVKHKNEIHRKYAWAAACLIFLFIGAPMGTIVRKGGFGWPLLFSIIFFVFYIMSSIAGEKMAENLAVSSFLGMWMPNIVLLPLGVFLTWKAMNDSKLLNLETYIAFFRMLTKILGAG